MNSESAKNIHGEILINEKDLPLSCPVNQTWDGHPKVYLNIKEKGNVVCPYCGAKYKLNLKF